MTTVDVNHWSALKTRVFQAAESLQQVLRFKQKKNNTALTESFSEYAKVWQDIANEACSYDFDGLCDVCMLFQASALDVDRV